MLKSGKVHSIIRETSRMRARAALFLSAALLATSGFSASSYTWVKGATDWDSEDSYSEAGKPGDGDIVKIPKGVTVTVDDDSVNFIE